MPVFLVFQDLTVVQVLGKVGSFEEKIDETFEHLEFSE